MMSDLEAGHSKALRNNRDQSAQKSGISSLSTSAENNPEACTRLDSINHETESHGVCGYLLIILAGIAYVALFPVFVFCSFKIIRSYERGIMLRLGKVLKHKGSTVLGSGIQFALPFVDTIYKVDMRTISESIPPQEILTKDSVTVSVDAIVYMRVIEPTSALLRVENWRVSARMLAVSMLRSALGNYDLSSLLTNRSEIDSLLRKQLDEATTDWGIKVERVEIMDVSLPQEMQRAMAAEAQATRAANAKVIAAKGEVDSAEMLRQAAVTMSASPAALQLRYLQTLGTIATEHNSTIVFPLPIELMDIFQSKQK